MSRSGITQAALVFASATIAGVILGSVIGGMVGYPTEWTATGAISGIAFGLFTSQW